MTQQFTADDVREFRNELKRLASQVCTPPIRLGIHLAATKEEAAAYVAEHTMKSSQTDVWMVIADGESTHDAAGEIEHAICTAVTGNGSRSEVHARLYTLLHNNLDMLIDLLGAYLKATLSGELEIAVNTFAEAMTQKLHIKQAEGYDGWDDWTNERDIHASFKRHVDRFLIGEPQEIDCANLLMMLWKFRMDREQPSL